MEAHPSPTSITFSICKPSSLTHQKIQGRYLNFTPKCWTTSITFSICKPSSLTHQKIQGRYLNFTPKCWKKVTISFRAHAGTSLEALPGSLSSRNPIPVFVNDYSPSLSAATSPPPSVACENRYWMVLLERPTEEAVQSKEEVTNYYVGSLQKVLGSDNDAQSCIYDISYDGIQFGFCCNVDEDTSRALAGLPEVLSVRPDLDKDSAQKDYSLQLKGSGVEFQNGRALLFEPGSSKHWLVRTDNPPVTVNNKAEMVDYYVQILTKVLGNEKDAQMCIYHASLLPSYFGFCCELDEECARELTGVPGVLSVKPDENFVSENKDYEGNGLLKSSKSLDALDSSDSTQVKTKKLFITGLSFYTSEKTLRAAFEPFGELVEVKVIMDKISKRSKGYAFVEYATEEAAGKALKEMNGKIINGWMIVVDVAKSKPKFSSSRFGQNPRF